MDTAASTLPQDGPARPEPAPQPTAQPDPRPAGRRVGRIAVLDGLRLLAALMVVAHHYLALGGTAWDGEPTSQLFPQLHILAAYGRFGVELFFLISGFVICMSTWGKSLSDFFTSRVIRLFPAYWFAVLATTAVVALVPGGLRAHHWRDVLVNLTMLHRPIRVDDVDGVYWTLWAEMRFYLIFALVVWRGVTYRKVVAFCCLWSVGSILMAYSSLGPVRGLLLPGECWFFIAGLAFYLIHRFGPDLLLWSIVVFSYLMGQHEAMAMHRDLEHALGYAFPAYGTTALITAFFLIMAAVSLGWFKRINWRWLPTAGALTYPLYLLHEYIGWELIRSLRGHAPPLALAGIAAAAMLVAAWLVNRLLERPLSKVLRRSLKHSFERIRALDPGSGRPLPRLPEPRQPDPVGPGPS
ncbi:acyltransferase family protein [Streptomyces sp. NPDC092296]|uniref:acyltransferase family protein n=1 Tax=Streptomyces sp. NPDC092296 TaxID=3366012 RepID=UPI00380BD2B5